MKASKESSSGFLSEAASSVGGFFKNLFSKNTATEARQQEESRSIRQAMQSSIAMKSSPQQDKYISAPAKKSEAKQSVEDVQLCDINEKMCDIMLDCKEIQGNLMDSKEEDESADELFRQLEA